MWENAEGSLDVHSPLSGKLLEVNPSVEAVVSGQWLFRMLVGVEHAKSLRNYDRFLDRTEYDTLVSEESESRLN